jgi:hypothetical protein
LIAVTMPKAAAISQMAAHQRYCPCVTASGGASGALAVGVCGDGGPDSPVAMAISRSIRQRMLPVCPSE